MGVGSGIPPSFWIERGGWAFDQGSPLILNLTGEGDWALDPPPPSLWVERSKGGGHCIRGPTLEFGLNRRGDWAFDPDPPPSFWIERERSPRASGSDPRHPTAGILKIVLSMQCRAFFETSYNHSGKRVPQHDTRNDLSIDHATPGFVFSTRPPCHHVMKSCFDMPSS